MTAVNKQDKINGSPNEKKAKEIEINSIPPSPEQLARNPPGIPPGVGAGVGSQQQQQLPDLNNVVQDLKQLTNLCNQKVMEYADISATFKQIAQISDNLALGISVVLQSRGELDPRRFKLAK